MGHEVSTAVSLTLAVVDTRNQVAMNVGMEKKLRPFDRLLPEEIKHLSLIILKVFNKFR